MARLWLLTVLGLEDRDAPVRISSRGRGRFDLEVTGGAAPRPRHQLIDPVVR